MMAQINSRSSCVRAHVHLEFILAETVFRLSFVSNEASLFGGSIVAAAEVLVDAAGFRLALVFLSYEEHHFKRAGAHVAAGVLQLCQLLFQRGGCLERANALGLGEARLGLFIVPAFSYAFRPDTVSERVAVAATKAVRRAQQRFVVGGFLFVTAAGLVSSCSRWFCSPCGGRCLGGVGA
jgi:hypothetical protein